MVMESQLLHRCTSRAPGGVRRIAGECAYESAASHDIDFSGGNLVFDKDPNVFPITSRFLGTDDLRGGRGESDLLELVSFSGGSNFRAGDVVPIERSTEDLVAFIESVLRLFL
jgi:hypothetical protein